MVPIWVPEGADGSGGKRSDVKCHEGGGSWPGAWSLFGMANVSTFGREYMDLRDQQAVISPGKCS